MFVYIYVPHIKPNVRTYVQNHIRHKLIGHPMSLWKNPIDSHSRLCIRFPSIPIIFKIILPCTQFTQRVYSGRFSSSVCTSGTSTSTHTHSIRYGKLKCANKCACLNAHRFLMVELNWAVLCWFEMRCAEFSWYMHVQENQLKFQLPMHFGSKVRKLCKQQRHIIYIWCDLRDECSN